MKKHSKIIILFLLALPLMNSCETEDDPIPRKQVNIRLFSSDPEFNNLNVVGGWVYLSGGSRGIVAYRRSLDEIVAFDRHCSYQPSDACGQVEVDGSGLILNDSCCNSAFLITDGSVSRGPAVNPLLKYYTDFDGSVLLITN